MNSAMKYAYYFVGKGYDYPRNQKKGNMKLQKLLYFSQLVHYSEFNKSLFDDEILAFENGCIVDEVMNDYRFSHDQVIKDATESEVFLSDEEKFTLELVEEVYGKLSADELSDLNHEHACWKNAYKIGSYKTKINYEHFFEIDVPSMRKVVDGYKLSRSNPKAVINIQGTDFYYDPSEIVMNDDLIATLYDYVGGEESFTVYKDEDQGIVIF